MVNYTDKEFKSEEAAGKYLFNLAVYKHISVSKKDQRLIDLYLNMEDEGLGHLEANIDSIPNSYYY